MKNKAKKIRLILICIIILFDLTLLPWILKFPIFLINDIATAPSEWVKYGILGSIKDIFIDAKFLKLYLFMQISIFALIITIAWDVNKFKKKNRIVDGVGGPEPVGSGQHGTSRWQTKKEMDQSSVVWYTDTKLNKGGIILGMEKNNRGKEKVWLDNDDTHNLIIGSTRSGKSRKINLPTIWEIAKSGESMVIGDPKGELFISTKNYLEKEGYKVISLNLREPLKGNQWNMLHMVNEAIDNNDIPKASELAWNIAHTIVNQIPAPTSEPIWKNGAESTIAALILLTAIESEFKFQRHMTTAYYLLSEYGQAIDIDGKFVPLIEYIKNLPVRHPAKSAFSTALIAPPKTRTSFFTTVLSDLRLFSDPTIADMTSKQDHNLEDIGIEKTAVFLIIPDEVSTRNVLATLYIDQVYQSLVNLSNRHGGRLPRRVRFILDEFGNLPAIPDFDKKLTVAGGRGISFTLSIQDITQLKKLYDKNSQTITGNCHNWIYLLTADYDTAKLISEKTGKYTVETESSNSSVQSKGHSFGAAVSMTGRSLLMPDEVLRWPSNEALVIRARQFPARYPLPDLSLWKANKELGFVYTGDIDLDKELNRQIIEKRWQEISPREIEEISIFLPEILKNNQEETIISQNEVSTSDDITNEINVENDMQINTENILDIILQQTSSEFSSETEDDEYEEDFL